MVYLSLCIPTNGISEWIFPVLDNIYKQNIDESLYEVVVTDNGDNQEFYKQMIEYAAKHKNLIYKKTDVYLFQNQIEALRLANGEYLKFVNHRALLLSGSIQWMIDLIRENMDEKPVIYLSNGVLHLASRLESDFDGFVRGLKQYASWTTGVGVWKKDFEKIPNDKVYNKISPHSDVLFAEREKSKYIIEDRVWSTEIDSNHSKKGRYDLYKTFGCDELTITLELYVNGDITGQTFKEVKKAYKNCVIDFYVDFSLLKRPCSYILDGFDETMGIFFSKREILSRAYLRLFRVIAIKIYQGIKKFRKK